MDLDFLETLLSQNESDHLDFKATLYKKETIREFIKRRLSNGQFKIGWFTIYHHGY